MLLHNFVYNYVPIGCLPCSSFLLSIDRLYTYFCFFVMPILAIDITIDIPIARYYYA